MAMAATSIETLRKSEEFSQKIQKDVLGTAFGETTKALELVFTSNGEFTASQLDELRDCMQTYAECDQRVSHNRKVLAQIKGQLQQGQAPPMEDYVEFLRQRSDALAANEPPASQHPKCKEFENTLADLTAAREDDDELQMVGADINLKCPITMSVYEATGGMVPLKSKQCGHTYSKSGVAMLFRKATTAKCPVQGCGETVTKGMLAPDREVLKELERVQGQDEEEDNSQMVD